MLGVTYFKGRAMSGIGTITMSMREIDRLKTIQAVKDGRLKPGLAARRLELSVRQVQRLVIRYEAQGAAGLVSGKRGRAGNHQLVPGIGSLALGIIRELYADFGPTLACEKLRECHELDLSKETVRKLMTEAGLWIPRRQRTAKIYQPRNRRNCLGELIQIDGSDHEWFEDRAPRCTLLVYVDDATSRLMHLHFASSESTFSYFEATRAYLERHGKPQALYSDKASVFRDNSKKATKGEACTQFGRALFELNITLICANSSQAKGRVERMNLSLQDRLVKQMRLDDISDMAAANAWCGAFIDDYNKRFAKPPRNDLNTHRPLRGDDNLDLVFTVRETRKVSPSLTTRRDNMYYSLRDTPEARAQIGKEITFYEYPDRRIEIRQGGHVFAYTEGEKRPIAIQAKIVDNKRIAHILRVAQEKQKQRDGRRVKAAPARANSGIAPAQPQRAPATKPVKAVPVGELLNEIKKARIRSKGATGKPAQNPEKPRG